jgi:hypothetical protein
VLAAAAGQVVREGVGLSRRHVGVGGRRVGISHDEQLPLFVVVRPAVCAEASRISVITVRNFELGKSKPQQSTLYLMQQAFEQEGIEFIDGNAPGVRMKPR